MRSLIIIEVEHGETTDDVDAFMDYMCSTSDTPKIQND